MLAPRSWLPVFALFSSAYMTGEMFKLAEWIVKAINADASVARPDYR